MVAVEPAMNLKMRIEPHSKPPFDSQGVLSHMSAPDFSFWSQMEGTSLFCNSAAIAAAASEAAVNMQNSSMPLFGSQSVMDSNHPFQSLAHLPTAFNLNLTHQEYNQQSEQHQQSSVSHHPSSTGGAFWQHGSPQGPHDQMMFNQNPIQKLNDFRTVMLPTEEKLSPNTNSPYCTMGNTSMSVNNTIMCQVCVSAPSNGLHFGAKVCAACAAFFRRSVSDNKKYVCKRSQRCTLKVNDSTGYRKICRECRFKRCLDIGMLPENVQHKRHRREADNILQHQNPQNPLLSGHSSIGHLGSHHGDYLDLFNHHHAATGLSQPAGLNFNMSSH
ncbi:hypothetical protein FO519_009439 [Halicephalobus sp. NKZ332]|nr:hypothetical protein FO519_009439 [Halicephalobus sp. NKZ332]